jgi:heterodisulfide reductase subunit A
LEDSKIAVFICTCNKQIGTNIDLDRLETEVSSLPNVAAVKRTDSLCTKSGQEFMKNELKESNADRVVVAACTPRTYEEIIRKGALESGINRNLYEQTGIREQCEWIHTDKEFCTNKAICLVKSAIAKVTFSEKIDYDDLQIKNRAVLIIGGGIAGMQASLMLAQKGIHSYIIEREKELGGMMAKLSPRAIKENGIELPKPDDILKNENIDVFFESEVINIQGGLGDYEVTIQRSKPTSNQEQKDDQEKVGDQLQEQVIEVGGVIIATGSKIFDSNRIPELHFDYQDVITSLDIEKMLTTGEIKVPSNNSNPRRINFIQCVGSRDENKGNPHCSLVCCTYAIRQAIDIKTINPDISVLIHYMDLRGPYPGFEELYTEAQNMGVQFIRGRVAEIQKVNNDLILRAENIDLDELVDWGTDLIVLSVGQEPNEGTDKLSDLLHIPLDVDGFLGEYNYRWDIIDRRGISVAGSAQGPRNIKHAMRDANRAAAEITKVFVKGSKAKDAYSIINTSRCTGCGICEALCPYDAISLDKIEDFEMEEVKLVSKVNVSLCQACGACTMACPSNVPVLSQFTADQILAEIEAVT